MSKEIKALKKTLVEHKIMTQVFRWFQYYESEEASLDHHLDLLDPSFEWISPTSKSKGIDQYLDRLSEISPEWQHAYHFGAYDIEEYEDYYMIELDLIYQNLGIDQLGNATNVPLHYSIKMEDNEQGLPKFLSMHITPESLQIQEELSDFQDTYIEHRLKSVISRWLTNMERNNGQIEGFKEILQDSFTLLFAEPIEDLTAFQQWVHWSKETFMVLSHQVEDLKLSQINKHVYQIVMEFEWKGATRENPEEIMDTRTRHKWQVIEDPTLRFPQIKKIDVSVVIPDLPGIENG